MICVGCEPSTVIPSLYVYEREEKSSTVFILRQHIYAELSRLLRKKNPPLYANNLTLFHSSFHTKKKEELLFGFKAIHLLTDALLFLFAQTLLYIVVYV